MHANGVKFVLVLAVLVLFEHLDPQACADYTFICQFNTTRYNVHTTSSQFSTPQINKMPLVICAGLHPGSRAL